MSVTVAGFRRLALVGVLTGLAAAVPYAEPIPWIELQTLIVFAAGYLLGVRAGALVGGLAIAFYSLANPYGPAHPAVFAAQILGRASNGAMGGAAARLGLGRALWVRGGALALWAVAASLVYDALTNLAVAWVFGPWLPTLAMAVPFALGHLASNVGLFVIVGVPLSKALESRRAALLGAMLVLAASIVGAPANAQPPDTLEATPPDTLAATPIDTLAATPIDTLGAAPVDTAATAPDTIVVPTPARVPPPPPPGWSLVVSPRAHLRRAPVGIDDALERLAVGPRFYGDAGSVEPLRFAALPLPYSIGRHGRLPLLPRSTPWEEPGRIPAGGRAGLAWSSFGPARAPGVPATAPPAPGGEVRAGGAYRAEWTSRDAEAASFRPLTAVWAGTGDFGHGTQGFALQFFRRQWEVGWRLDWSAWSRGAGLQGALGETGSHGLRVGFSGRGDGWEASFRHASDRFAIEDRDAFRTERRGQETTIARFRRPAPENGLGWGLSAERVEDRTAGEGPILSPFRRTARQHGAVGWIERGLRGGHALFSLGWERQRVRHEIVSAGYAPEDLTVWSAALEAGTGRGLVRGGLAFEAAGGVARLLPWARAGASLGGGARWFAEAGATSAPALAEAGKLADPDEGPAVERPHGWTGTLGLRLERGLRPGEDRLGPAESAAPLSPGELHVQLAVLGWSLERVLFPGFGLLAREVLEAEASSADVEGVSGVVAAEWSPLRGVELGAVAYAAARDVPAGAPVAAPDARALVWAGPRFRLFDGSLEIFLAGELDALGERAAPDEILPAVLRPGARLVLGLGDAWLVLRAVDLDDARHPLPGRRFDGERLRSAGRTLRLYGEWRLLD